MTKLKYPLNVWRNIEDGINYGFPVGAKDPWGGEVVPLFQNQTWEYWGQLPAEQKVKNVKIVQGNRVKCQVGGQTIDTADWALE
jgi:hypothetical protein